MPLVAAPALAANNIVPFAAPAFSLGAPAGLVAGALASVAVIPVTIAAAASAYQAEQDLAKAKQIYENQLKRYQETSTGNRSISDSPPFTGGQSVAVFYAVIIAYDRSGGTRYINMSFPNYAGGMSDPNSPFLNASANIFIGPISSIIPSADSTVVSVVVTHAGGTSPVSWNEGVPVSNARIFRVFRVDLQPDTGGNVSTPTTQAPAGYTGTPNEQDRNKVAPAQPKIVPPYLSPAVGWGPSKAIDGRPALGIGVAPSPTRTPERPLPNPNRNPSPTPPSPNRAPSTPPSPKRDDEKKVIPPFVPPQPTTPDDIRKDLTGLAAIIAAIAGATQFDNLKNAAKAGSCESLQSPSCTQSLKDDIKNPINAKLDAAQVARDANAATQTGLLGNVIATQATHTGFFGTIIAKGNDIFEFIGRLWNNSIIDKAVGYLTLITVIHNAAMLSRSIAETLGSAIDQGLIALGWGFSDKDGNIIGINQAIGNSIQDLLRKSVGNAVYEGISNTFTQANRVYQAGINLLSNVQSIIDSTTAVAELTSNRVATLMNALRSAGMVRENAYGSQTPNTTRFNAFMQKLENLEQGTSNLAAITGNIVSVQQSVNELKSNRTEFENAIQDKNTVVEAEKTEKRADSVFTIGDFSITRAPEQTP